MKNLFEIVCFAVIILIASCAQTPEGGEAVVSEAKEVAPVATDGSNYKADVQKSVIEWIGSKPTGQHSGIVRLAEGTLTVNGDKIVAGNFVIDMNTIEGTDQAPEDNKDLADHLKDADFFEAAKYPTAKLEITSVEPFAGNPAADSASADGKAEDNTSIEGANYNVTGNLTIRDITKSISFPAKIQMDSGQITAEAVFNINRTDWGVVYRSDKSLGNKIIHIPVNIRIKLLASKV